MTTQTPTKTNALATILHESGLDQAKAGAIIETLAPLVEQAGDLCRQAEEVNVTAADQLTEMRQAREIRLKLVKVRTGAEAARKVLKADALALGKAIDACGNWIKNQTEPVEARLMECELFAERAKLRRKQQVRDERYALLAEVGPVDAAIVNTLGDMAQAAFDAMLQGAKLAKKAREEAAAKAEAERIAREKADAQERERLRVENERLKAERAEQDRLAAEAAERERKAREAIVEKARKEREATEQAARAEREKAELERRKVEEQAKREREAAEAKYRKEREEREAKLQQEREAREKLEREQRERDAAEKKRRDAEARAAKKAAAAPDADKLRAYAKSIGAIKPPTCSTQEGRNAVMRIEAALEVVLDSISLAADEIGGGE